jgi:putative endonuclease
MSYYAYLVQCADDTLYAGITTDLERRVEEHNTSELGAKYTRARRPVRLVYSEQFLTRSEAQKREAQFKKLSREKKRELIEKR